MSDRKIGCFRVDMQTIDGYPEIVREILSGLIVLRAEMRYDTRAIHYMALGDKFEECPKGMMAPDYYIDCEENEDGKPFVFIRGSNMEQPGDWLMRKLYDCQDCHDEGTVCCPKCAGSGEGMHADTKCLKCNNGGEVPCGCVETDEEPPERDRDE